MTSEQRERLFQDKDYADNYNELQSMVQQEILNLVKGKIENTERGKELLNNQLKTVKKLKTRIINDTNKEMETFMKFREYAKKNPNATYEEFIKTSI
jgi:predicted methyltransferase